MTGPAVCARAETKPANAPTHELLIQLALNFHCGAYLDRQSSATTHSRHITPMKILRGCSVLEICPQKKNSIDARVTPVRKPGTSFMTMRISHFPK